MDEILGLALEQGVSLTVPNSDTHQDVLLPVNVHTMCTDV